jgi:hypothetical protein
MPEHLTFFGEYTKQTEALYWSLQELYKLERKDTLSDDEKSALVKQRIAVRGHIHRFRELLNSIEREHGLEPMRVIRPATEGK